MFGRMAEARNDWYQEVLQSRDEQYAQRFGKAHKDGIYTIEHFPEQLEQVDPRWHFCGTYAFEPTAERHTWIYVTAGLSTPFDIDSEQELPEDPDETPSGWGTELCMETEAFEAWAIHVLNGLLAYQLGVWHELLPGKMIDVAERIALKPSGLLPPETSPIQGLATRPPIDFEDGFTLRSGYFELIELVGITREEYAWSTANGVKSLLSAHEKHHRLVTKLDRPPLPLKGQVEMPAKLRSSFH